jgi:branched-chain amino acid aminotransferase
MNNPVAPAKTTATAAANGHATNGASHQQSNGSTPWWAEPKPYERVFLENQAGKGDKPLIWVNGRMVPKSEAMVSVYDHGLLYGDGVFEGIRVYKGKIFKCAQHMDRLWRCAEAIQMKIPVSREDMVDIQRRCIAANGLTDAYIRLIVSRGAGGLGLDLRKCPVPGVICIADQIALYPPELYQTGMKVVVAKRPRIPIACLDPRIKSLNYLNNILAKSESFPSGALESLMLTTDGWVGECTGDNIFIVKGGRVYTPPTSAGILEGITRQFVIDTLCPKTGTAVEEKMMRLDEVLSADEVFLTGSAAEMIAVTSVEKDGQVHTISDGEGPVTKRLRTLFREIVTSENVPED